jgi:hypothetical protein
MKLGAFLEQIHDPPTTYRSAPLWDWNDSICEREDNRC